jgi:hypothetical protein
LQASVRQATADAELSDKPSMDLASIGHPLS